MLRRTFCGLSVSSLLLPNFSFGADNKSDKSVIFVYLQGGISQKEFTHAGPGSVNGVIETKNAGILGGDFTNLAQVSHLFTNVQNFRHRDGNHSSAQHWVLTGKSAFSEGPQKEPSNGSIISYLTQPNINGIPTYIRTNEAMYDKAAWLGAKYNGYTLSNENLKFEGNAKRKLDMLGGLDRVVRSQVEQDWKETKEQAVDISLGNAQQLFDLSRESIEEQNKYKVKTSPFGRQLLMAKRLVSNGVKFVQVVNGGWDNHSDISQSFKNKAPELDFGLATLISDINNSNLKDKVMIVVTTEFGRTVGHNSNGGLNLGQGRDHFPNVVPLIIAGGNFSHQVVGTANKNGDEITSNIVYPANLTATIFKHFGFDNKTKAMSPQGRPITFVENQGKSIL